MSESNEDNAERDPLFTPGVAGAGAQEIEHLEQLLGRYRYEPSETELDAVFEHAAPRRRMGNRRWFGLAALAAGLMVALLFAVNRRGGVADGYRVSGVDGISRLQVGDELFSDSAASLEIAGLGQVDLEPKSSLRVEEIAEDAHRLYLANGALEARIIAAPRLFQVGTPAGLTVDLGCAYSLRVADDGTSTLRVTSGQVAFEFDGREVYVPEGAVCVSVPGRGPDAPVFEDAEPAFKAAVRAVEFAAVPDPELIKLVLDVDRQNALTLWHLLDAPSEELRNAVYDRLSKIFPPPRGTPLTRAGILGGDVEQRAAWMEVMRGHWNVTSFSGELKNKLFGD